MRFFGVGECVIWRRRRGIRACCGSYQTVRNERREPEETANLEGVETCPEVGSIHTFTDLLGVFPSIPAQHVREADHSPRNAT